jgi:tripartite-type tricarboxylate transporter receptor subunit TctC
MKWRWAASGPADGLGNGAAFTCEALKLDCQIVPGYGGSAQSGLAVTRGEMDAVYVPESSANNFVKAKQNLALATIGRKKSRWFLDHPTIFEAVELTEDARWLFDFFTGVEEMGRIMMVPPNMPKARLAYLQTAIKETLHNPQLIAEGERTERIIEYLDAESTLKNAQTIVSNVTPEQKKRVQAILARNK